MLRIKVKDKAVRALIGHLAFTGNRATAGLRKAVLRQTMKVQAAAEKLTPHEEGHLQAGAQSDVTMLGDSKLMATITFGGRAEAYAEVQHENEEFTHTLSEYAQKYGFSTASQVRRNRKTGLLELGPERIVGKRKKWRKLRGHEGGQAHFLHGADNSAWDTGGRAEADMNKVIQDALEADYQKAVSRGGID